MIFQCYIILVAKSIMIEQKIQTGFSRRYWLHSDLENDMSDSTSNDIKGMYFEFENKYLKNDSTLFLTVGYRYVDPNFRVLVLKQGVWIILAIETQFIHFIQICH